MGSLKEIKTRISSVNSTKKITSAMKMVASAKLRKAQKNIENFLPYEQKLNGILQNFLNTDCDFSTPFSENRPVNRVAIVAITSNSSLCGAFNSTVVKEMNHALNSYKKKLPNDNILLFPVGKKAADAAKKYGIKAAGNFEQIIDNPSYSTAIQLAEELMNLFLAKKVDKVELIYQHFKSTSSQELTHENFLPIYLTSDGEGNSLGSDYIIEPDKTSVLNELLPKSLRLKIYTALLDSYAAEQAARTLAMQIATDNAEDLLQELTIQYNKSRQQAITNELLDIIGGAQK